MKKSSNNIINNNQKNEIKEKLDTLIDFHINLIKEDKYKDYVEFRENRLIDVMSDFFDKVTKGKNKE